VHNVGAAKCCAINCYQHFSHKKTLLLKQEFWSLSFDNCKTYGLNIPRRLHMKGDGRWRKFIIIHGLDIYKNVWYQIVGFSTLTYMLYKSDNKRACHFLPHGNKGIHKLHMSTQQANFNVQSLINLFADTMLHQMKGLEMVDKTCNIFYLKHGRLFKNTMIRWILWNNQHFLFLSGDKRLVSTRWSSWKTSFWKIEMDFEYIFCDIHLSWRALYIYIYSIYRLANK